MMKQIMFLIVIVSLVAVSFAGHHHNPEFKAIKEKACDTNTKLTEKQWSDLVECKAGSKDTRMADFQSAVSANCSSAANEPELQTLKITGKAEQNALVNDLCSKGYMKCKFDLIKLKMKDHKKGESDGNDEHKKKHEEMKQKMADHLKCMQNAVGIKA